MSAIPLVTFGVEETETVVRLLDDYSRRLQNLLDQADRLREESVAVYVQILLFMLLLILSFFLPRYFNQYLTISLLVAVTSIFFHSTVLSLRYIFVGRHRRKRLASEIKTLTPRLKRLAQLASQIEEHTTQDPGRRLDFDFQLFFSEKVLERAESGLYE